MMKHLDLSTIQVSQKPRLFLPPKMIASDDSASSLSNNDDSGSSGDPPRLSLQQQEQERERERTGYESQHQHQHRQRSQFRSRSASISSTASASAPFELDLEEFHPLPAPPSLRQSTKTSVSALSSMFGGIDNTIQIPDEALTTVPFQANSSSNRNHNGAVHTHSNPFSYLHANPRPHAMNGITHIHHPDYTHMIPAGPHHLSSYARVHESKSGPIDPNQEGEREQREQQRKQDEEDRQISGAAEALAMMSRGNDLSVDRDRDYNDFSTYQDYAYGYSHNDEVDVTIRNRRMKMSSSLHEYSSTLLLTNRGPLKKRCLRPQIDMYTINTGTRRATSAKRGWDKSPRAQDHQGHPSPSPSPTNVVNDVLRGVHSQKSNSVNLLMPPKRFQKLPLLNIGIDGDECEDDRIGTGRSSSGRPHILTPPYGQPIFLPPRIQTHQVAALIHASSNMSSSDEIDDENERRKRIREETKPSSSSSSSSFLSHINNDPTRLIPSSYSNIRTRPTITSTRPPGRPRPTKLVGPDDVENLNSLHQFVRSDLLEIFEVGVNHAAGGVTHNNKNEDITKRHGCTLFKGRVGIRCVHCKHLPRDQQGTGAVFYPRNIRGLYRNVCTWQRVHFKLCTCMPESAKQKYKMYKENDKTRGRTSYWESSALALGLRDCQGVNGRGGIKFV